MGHKQNTYLNLASIIFQGTHHRFFQAFPIGEYIFYFLCHLFVYLSIALLQYPDTRHRLSPGGFLLGLGVFF